MRDDGVLVVFSQPDSGEMTPTQLPDDNVATIGKGVPNVDGVVTTFDVVLEVFLVFGHDGIRNVGLRSALHWGDHGGTGRTEE